MPLIELEGCYVGAIGSLAGGVIGLLGSAVFAGAIPLSLVLTTAVAVLAGTCAGALASALPAIALRRQPLTQVLAAE